MAEGPGIYDELCTEVRERTGAAAVVLIVAGKAGMGVSVQAPPQVEALLPGIFRELAAEIEQGLAARVGGAH